MTSISLYARTLLDFEYYINNIIVVKIIVLHGRRYREDFSWVSLNARLQDNINMRKQKLWDKTAKAS